MFDISPSALYSRRGRAAVVFGGPVIHMNLTCIRLILHPLSLLSSHFIYRIHLVLDLINKNEREKHGNKIKGTEEHRMKERRVEEQRAEERRAQTQSMEEKRTEE